jgi:dTDP-4-dehydrorhamnose reductase
MAKPILLVGDRGMLGRAFRELFARTNRAYEGFDLPAFDAAEQAQVAAVFARPWSALINCAAFTNVDAAESDEPAAMRGNATAPRVLAEACVHAGIPLLHFSTDYVFAGNAQQPYPVDALIQPLGAYGRTKAAGESAIREASETHQIGTSASGVRYLIVRTSWLYAPWANNFVRTMAKLSRDKPALKVVNDQRGRPTSAEHLAKSALALLDRGVTGTFHVTDGGECTWYELTCAIAEKLGRTCTISPCTTAEFPRPAPRPTYSVLDLSKTEALLGPMPAWQDNLASVLARLEPL